MTKDEALIEYCKTLLQDPEVVEQDGWQKLVVIGEVTSASTKIFGYSYNLQGEGQLTSPSNGKSADKLEALYTQMKAENDTGRGWLKCMIRISRLGEIGADLAQRLLFLRRMSRQANVGYNRRQELQARGTEEVVAHSVRATAIAHDP